MATIRQILVATDFSDNAINAVEAAAALARIHSATLTIINAVESIPMVSAWGDPGPMAWIGMPQMVETAKIELEKEVARISNKHTVNTQLDVIIGSAHREIVHKARELNADLIVVGARGKRNIVDRLLGSTAQNVVRASTIPVLVIHHPTPQRWENALVATDFSDNAVQAAMLASSLFKIKKITLLHADEPMHDTLMALARLGNEEITRFRQQQAEQSERAIADQARDLKAQLQLDVDTIHQLGEATDVIANQMANQNFRLLVVGSHGRNRLEAGLLGSVSQKILSQIACDVLVVRQQT